MRKEVPMESALREWLPRQRWFAGKHDDLTAIRVVEIHELHSGDPSLLHAVVEAVTDRRTTAYQLLIGARPSLPSHLDHARIGTDPERGELYDALADGELMTRVLYWIAENAERDGFSFQAHPQAHIDTDAPPRMLGVEQSNSSVVFGEEALLKIFRILVPGTNPDLEITQALTDADNPHIAPLYGWIEAALGLGSCTLGLLQEYLRTGSDGWSLALTSVRDLFAEGDLHAGEVGGDFAAEAERLGMATADVHLTLRRVLPTHIANGAQVRQLAEGMRRRLDAALEVAPELGEYARTVREAFDEFAATVHELPLQRIHGDLHLGQVMRTERGWVLFDFEGEPGAPIDARSAPSSPLRDVAGMLRSFDYAAHYLLAGQSVSPHLVYRATEWSNRNRTAFCIGYAKVADRDPREEHATLRAFELDKAVYEVAYEKRNRPDWVSIPLRTLERLLTQ
ncbi:MAG: phosphotransferase [Acidothermus sp.]|nr:phosphotransferase [Acidothermus sp.]MCL6537255.1 phosphotransferase [Acidothermus sp.]